MWSFMLSVFLLSYKLSTSVLSVYVLKRSSETSRICQGKHGFRSLFYVGLLFWFCNVNVKCFNSGTCISISK